MKAALPLNPRKLDVAACAAKAVQLQGDVAVAQLERLHSERIDAPSEGAELAHWSVEWGLEPVRGGTARPFLRLTGHATVHLQCQRCLSVMAVDLEVDRRFWFAPDEAQAAAWDEDTEDDVLVGSRSFDVLELLEDELLLALPLVPRHEVCPVPLLPASSPSGDDQGAGAEPSGSDDAPAHPFAVLAQLKRPH